MDVVVTPLNKVYFLGGSLDSDCEKLTNIIFEWNLITKRINEKSMPNK